MGVEVSLHSFLISQLDGVIGQRNSHAALQPVKIPRHALSSSWPHVGNFLGDLEKRKLLPQSRIKLWFLGRLDRIVIIVPTEPFRLQSIYYSFTLLSDFLSDFYSPFFLLPSYLHFSSCAIFSSVFLPPSYNIFCFICFSLSSPFISRFLSLFFSCSYPFSTLPCTLQSILAVPPQNIK